MCSYRHIELNDHIAHALRIGKAENVLYANISCALQPFKACKICAVHINIMNVTLAVIQVECLFC